MAALGGARVGGASSVTQQPAAPLPPAGKGLYRGAPTLPLGQISDRPNVAHLMYDPRVRRGPAMSHVSAPQRARPRAATLRYASTRRPRNAPRPRSFSRLCLPSPAHPFPSIPCRA